MSSENRSNGTHLTTEHPDPEYVQSLSPHILLAHVDDTFEPESGTSGSRGNTVLSSTSLGDNSLFTKPTSEQDLQFHGVGFRTSP